MKIVKPSVHFLDDFKPNVILTKLENAGRTCYKSENKTTADSAGKFIKMLIEHGHESVLEHVNVSVKFICDRGVSHELVRHRLASYSQESTRYVKYDDIEVIKPIDLVEHSKEYAIWCFAMTEAERCYKALKKLGVANDVARSVLPTCLKTEVVVTANLREWRHILKLRTSKAAHADIRYLMLNLLDAFKKCIPVVFDDIEA